MYHASQMQSMSNICYTQPQKVSCENGAHVRLYLCLGRNHSHTEQNKHQQGPQASVHSPLPGSPPWDVNVTQE